MSGMRSIRLALFFLFLVSRAALACGPSLSDGQLAVLLAAAAAPPLGAPVLGCLLGMMGGSASWGSKLKSSLLCALIGLGCTVLLTALLGVTGWMLSFPLNLLVGWLLGRSWRSPLAEPAAGPGLSPAVQ